MTIESIGEGPPAPEEDSGVGALSDEESVGQRTLVALSKVSLALREQAWRDAVPAGLNPTQAQILVILARRGQGGMRLSTIAGELGVSAPTASDSVSALVAKGLVAKGPAADDRRALAVVLTPEGEARAREMAQWPDLLLGVVDTLDPGEASVFLKALMKMIRELQVQGRIAPSRMCVTCRFFRPHVHDDPSAPHHCAFVDAPFGDRSLRVECVDHEAAAPEEAARVWEAFAG